MKSLRCFWMNPMIFARDWTKYDYVRETRLEVMKRKLSKAIDYLRNKIEYNQGIARTLRDELCAQVEKFREDYPSICLTPEKARDGRTVFVYNIAKEAEVEDLKWHFGWCGLVKSVILCWKDKVSNRVAYIEFEDEIYANIALCMNKSLFMGQRIQIVPRNMTVEVNIMQAITTFWGQRLESQFLCMRPVKSKLQLLNALSDQLHDLMEIYIEAENCGNNTSSIKIFDLIRRSKKSLSMVDRFENCNDDEC